MHQHKHLPRRFLSLCAGTGLAMSLAACNSETTMTRSFGQGTNTADEQRITSRPPLSLPPEYTLRPERPGVVRPVAGPSGQPAPGVPGRNSAGQSALLDAAGPAAAPDIRTKVNEDAQMETAVQGFTDQLMTFQRPPDQPPIIQRGSSSGGFLGRLF